MISRLFVAAALAVSATVPFASAVAQPSSQIPGLHLFFTTPNGTAYQTSPIDVFVTLALDAGAPAFNFNGDFYDPDSPTPFGLPASSLPTTGFMFDADNTPDTFAPKGYHDAALFLQFGCGGTFLPDCDISGPPYDFSFAPFTMSEFLSLAPGSSTTFLFGTFTPTGGIAPPGTYTFFDVELVAQVNGFDDAGNEIFGFTGGLVNTCDNLDPSCAFTRNVVPAPEPATLGLLTLGLGFVGAVRRRRA